MRKKVIKCILYAIFPLLFNVLFFALGGAKHPASVWISYVWIHLAYLLMLATSLFIRKTQSARIFHFTTSQISSIYFGIEFVIGLIFIFIRIKSIKAPIIIQLVPFCLFMFVFLWNMLHNEHTADNEEKRAIEVNFIKSTSSKVKTFMSANANSECANALEKLYDEIHSSPSKSCPTAKGIEDEIMKKVDELGLVLLENQCEAKDLTKNIILLVQERNRIVNLSN